MSTLLSLYDLARKPIECANCHKGIDPRGIHWGRTDGKLMPYCDEWCQLDAIITQCAIRAGATGATDGAA